MPGSARDRQERTMRRDCRCWYCRVMLRLGLTWLVGEAEIQMPDALRRAQIIKRARSEVTRRLQQERTRRS
jgi:hypothetical protein